MRFQLLLFLLFLLVFDGAFAGNGVTIKTIVIDAGHGGKDPGATGPGKTNEKEVALEVALKLGEYIQKNFPQVNIIYTRQTDIFLELHERAEIANKNKADLFIAIHCNSSTSPQVYGTSTYVLGLHRTEANLEVAKRENSVILLEGDRDKNYEFDPNSPEGNIIMSMKQNAFLDQSIDIASKIENQFETVARRKSLGLKQAGFYVLYKTTMPSLLSEIGFISNPDEEKFLSSAKGQDQIASALFKAFKDYKFEMENRDGEPVAETETKKPVEAKTETKKVVETKTETKTETKKPAETKTVTSTPPPAANQEDKPAKQADVSTKETPPAKTGQPVVSNDPSVITTASGRKIRKPIENSSGGGVSPNKPAVKPAVKTEAPTKPVVAENKPAKPAVDNSVKASTAKKAEVDKEQVKEEPLAVADKTETKKPLEAPADKSASKSKTVTNKPIDDNKSETPVVEKKTEDKTVVSESKAPAKSTAPVKTNTDKPAVTKTEIKKPETDKPALAEENDENKPATLAKTEVKNAAPVKSSDKTVTTTQKDSKVVEKKTVVESSTVVKKENKPVVVAKTETKSSAAAREDDDKPAAAPKVTTSKPTGIQDHVTESGMVFKVQLFALKVPLKKTEHDKAVKLFSIVSSQALPNGITRYYAGDVKSYSAAKKLQNEAVNQGYRDAFIVGFKNGERLGATEMKAFEK